jgi:nucleotide-binding universal stress UspA family protein
MQPIVVAIDFSNTSIHALEYAIPLANKLKTDIVMTWVDKISTSESLYPDTSNESRNEAKKRFEEFQKIYLKRMGKGLRLDWKMRKGKVYHEIDNLARSVGASLIVAGAHGISGFEEYWIGSNAYKIVTYANCPVLTLRYDFPITKSIGKIILPMDSSAETIQKLPFITELAKHFKSEVHILATHSSHLKSIQRLAERYVQQAISYLFANGVQFVEDSIVSNDITKAMLQYSMDVDADMITIMTEQETPANIILGVHAQQVISQSPIPVLTIHPSERFSLK